MTDTPMTPDREQEIRTLDLLELMSDRAAPVISGHLAVLLAEVDRLRAEVSNLSYDVTGACLARYEEELDADRLRLALASAQRGRRELRARVAELEAARRPTTEFVSFSAVEEGDRVRFATADNGYGGMGEIWRTGTITRVTARTVVVDCDENLLGGTAVLRQAEWSARAVHRAPTVVPAENPWEQAAAGLNALVDADIAFHVEPDGHISNPFGDEHIEWDRDAARWRLVHDDEEGDVHPPHPAPCRVPASPDCTRPAKCQDCRAPKPAAGTRIWHRIGCPNGRPGDLASGARRHHHHPPHRLRHTPHPRQGALTMSTRKPTKPWRVILTQRGIQLVEIDHTSEAKAYQHVRTGLQAGADTARVEYWEGGLWRWFETVNAEDVQ